MNRLSPRLVGALLLPMLLGAGVSVQADEAAADGEERDIVRIAVDVPYPPMEYRTPEGELTGFDIDLGNALCERAQFECTWVVQNWDGIIPGLMARKYDAIMSSMRITEARSRRVLFTEPYALSPKVWVARQGRDIDIADRAGLKELNVGVQRGTTQDRYVTERYGDVLDIRRYATADDVAVDMQSGRLDLAFLNYPVALDTLQITRPESDFTQLGPRINSPQSIFGKGNAIAVRPYDRALAEAFNRALDDVYRDGTFERLMQRYFDYDIRPPSRD
ncbi:arginine/ornithine transport system substrate-binding protein [Kushneria sinocarnis]|uniref:Arginine/ornithine transport system substrate-binding protein n=1 Tax=Kushneria sinocarnis TaxID=595502 RepID=A0A420X077_9GAMM|nr:transporter substrate-binding domain-containing protein [Kushneria sinocarnis]RKR06855.1 arginine/ornithine transport system substrate-binding protein [Kushneria sinocarnis]